MPPSAGECLILRRICPLLFVNARFKGAVSDSGEKTLIVTTVCVSIYSNNLGMKSNNQVSFLGKKTFCAQKRPRGLFQRAGLTNSEFKHETLGWLTPKMGSRCLKQGQNTTRTSRDTSRRQSTLLLGHRRWLREITYVWVNKPLQITTFICQMQVKSVSY